MKDFFKLVSILLLLLPLYTKAQISPLVLADWESRKYSMFIHWGIYSELGGVWNGQNISNGVSEQIQAHAGIYSDTYAKVAKHFNPEKWNPEEIVLLAKNAGMKSIVFTSKHHDGFCMFHSKYTDFNIVDATPYKRDVLKELADACRKYDMRFALYFSLIDWHYPQAAPISSHNSDCITPEHFEYNKKQIEELLTNYGPVSELWFDMGSQSFEQSKEMYEWVHKLQPDCMIGSRLGNDMNDFVVMSDNQEPDYIIGVPWQSPASFFHETWGYRSWQERENKHGKMQEKLASLIRVVSRGGNYLLNIGPRGDGSVVEYERDVLLDIGNWLKKNGEAIYNASPDPFHVPFSWGSITSKPNKLYLHVMKMPENRTLVLKGITGQISGARILSDNETCAYRQKGEELSIILPESVNPEKEYEVIAVTFTNGFTVLPVNPVALAKGVILNQHNAFKYYSNSGIDYNSRFQSIVKEEWTMASARSQKITPVLYYTDNEKGRVLKLSIGGKEREVTLDSGQAVNLNYNADKTVWGALYLYGPSWAVIEGMPGGNININTDKAWRKTSWEMGEEYQLEGDALTGYFVLQEIESAASQQVLVDIISGDGVQIALNGQVLAIHNNPYKKEKMNDIVLLNLKPGKNQLIIKLYNNFQKKVNFGIKIYNHQKIYRLAQPLLQTKAKENIVVNWRLANPLTPHQTLNLSNLMMKFE
ncbi:alpha-L-fucosidase [Dysgonomonas sp. GY75]|uniref:alpha-L-fucosidase n=1 Tax=Dysgonomonas sp. GY75 TaxID=2780419 RepID=UPI0018833BC1|nr:alpha-L-fucosidase [Dysgonomonas sp. GY75]MBF0648636.1 alpha-L-fucosidase [Dysgonomonas sp. GY75]